MLALVALGVGVATLVLTPAPPARPRDRAVFVPDDAPLPTPPAACLHVVGGFLLLVVFLAPFAPPTVPILELGATRALRWLGGPPMPAGPRAVRHDVRRVRVASRYPSSRIGVFGYRREALDANDRTMATCRVWGFETAEPEAPLLFRSVAVLPRGFDSKRHHEELPRKGPLYRAVTRPLGAARVLVMDVHEDGVILHRFSESRGHVGDTWHPTREHALSQIEDEYGEHDMAFVNVPFDAKEGPIAFFAYIDLDGSRVVRG